MKFSIVFACITMLITQTFCNNQTEVAGKSETSDTTIAPVPPAVFEKLVGTWQNEDGKTFERWTKNSQGGYQSVVFSIKGSDTSWNERADIYQSGGAWVFENTVSGQNDGKAVKFTSTFVNNNSVQFSNPDHDFPNDINYTLRDASTLNAFIIGKNKNGGLDTIPFNSKRIH